ncbi:hypothetical protein [Porphyrobacter sp. AAP60]|uniref:hypothetical protein n=1 Tax=Porphyrobacter sp. AAP60 TaxID=1523423 RepID=UPI0006B8F659|nr:hypothetical protein [Porphyrobacter sp. AAP60]KPF65163.1 hypothetical protein IP79_03005 [Porphyrobacter sp. AAP60]
MKFILLESRGGNYLVVAENVAWLRTAENGQTTVGIVGGQPLLVVGSVDEVAAKILGASAQEEAPVAQPVTTEGLVTAQPAPRPEPEPISPPPAPAPEPATMEPPAVIAPKREASERPRPARAQPMSLSDRLAMAAAPKVKAGTQRFMGMSE